MSENYNHGKIIPIELKDEVEKDFLEYAMSVIVSRALPDLRDGLKPVQRRVIFAMNDLNITADKPHKKSARIVGEVIGKYHPHGDSSVYEAMVRMAQDFSYRYPLVDGHGNFGSIDGDEPAAMRYTEARLSKISNWIIKDIDMDTVEFIDNYDASEKEPAYLTGYFPNLLVNGATGIAVGMATSIPPHNLGEVVDAINMYIENNDVTIDELLTKIKGVDFPTGAQIANSQSLIDAYKTGKGSVVVKSNAQIQSDGKKQNIIISDIPYQTNKTRIIERIAELAKNKTIEGISDIRDESNHEGIRVVVKLKNDANAQVVLKKMFKMTPLQSNFSINLLMLHNGIPKLLNLKQIIENYVNYQIRIIVNRSIFEKNKIEKRLHILKAMLTALDSIDKVIDIIRNSQTTEIAKEQLFKNFGFDDEQSKAILDMRLQRLVGLEREKVADDIAKLENRFQELSNLLESKVLQMSLLKNQLSEIKNKFADERRTQIIKESLTEIDEEELIGNEKIMLTVSNEGYIRRIDPNEFRTQKRGGKGAKINYYLEDTINQVVIGKMRNNVLFFTDKGKIYRIKAYEINEFKKASRGLPLVNYIQITKEENITSVILMEQKAKFKYLTFVTKKGIVKRTELSEFKSINNNGKTAIKLREGDELINVIPTNGKSTILIATSNGKITRIKEEEISVFSRSSFGIKGITLDEDDDVTSACSDFNNDFIATFSAFGRAKITKVDEYKIISRASKGVKVMDINERSGDFKSLLAVRNTDTVVIITSGGNIIKVDVNEIPILSRNAKGTNIINLKEDEYISAIALEWNKTEGKY